MKAVFTHPRPADHGRPTPARFDGHARPVARLVTTPTGDELVQVRCDGRDGRELRLGFTVAEFRGLVEDLVADGADVVPGTGDLAAAHAALGRWLSEWAPRPLACGADVG